MPKIKGLTYQVDLAAAAHEADDIVKFQRICGVVEAMASGVELTPSDVVLVEKMRRLRDHVPLAGRPAPTTEGPAPPVYAREVEADDPESTRPAYPEHVAVAPEDSEGADRPEDESPRDGAAHGLLDLTQLPNEPPAPVNRRPPLAVDVAARPGYGLARDLARRFTSLERVRVHGREDTPVLVTAELRRSAFFRGDLVDVDERRHSAYHLVRYDPPTHLKDDRPNEFRFGLTLKGGDVDPKHITGVVAWMRVNASSYAIGVERGDKEQHLHLQGCFAGPFKPVTGAITSIKAHMRRFLNIPAGAEGRKVHIFCKAFDYRHGHKLESYLGYTVKDFGSSHFLHFSSPDVTPERLEHAAHMRRLMDAGRDDKILLKGPTLLNSVEAFYAMHLSWAVPRPRFDVLICWMIQSGRYGFHQSLFMPYPHSTNPCAAIKAFAFVQQPWLCTLPDVWLCCFKGPDAVAFHPSPHEVKDSPGELLYAPTPEEQAAGELIYSQRRVDEEWAKIVHGADAADAADVLKLQSLHGYSPRTVWHSLLKHPVLRRYCRSYDDLLKFEPGICDHTLDDLSDDEAAAGRMRELFPELRAKPPPFLDVRSRRSASNAFVEGLEQVGRELAETPTDGKCFYNAIGRQVLASAGADPLDGADRGYFQFGITVVSSGLRYFAGDIARDLVRAGVDPEALLSEVKGSFEVQHFSGLDLLLYYIWRRSNMLMAARDHVEALPLGSEGEDSLWGGGVGLVDVYAIGYLLKEDIFFYADGRQSVDHYYLEGDVLCSETIGVNQFEPDSPASIVLVFRATPGARGAGHYLAGLSTEPAGLHYEQILDHDPGAVCHYIFNTFLFTIEPGTIVRHPARGYGKVVNSALGAPLANPITMEVIPGGILVMFADGSFSPFFPMDIARYVTSETSESDLREGLPERVVPPLADDDDSELDADADEALEDDERAAPDPDALEEVASVEDEASRDAIEGDETDARTRAASPPLAPVVVSVPSTPQASRKPGTAETPATPSALVPPRPESPVAPAAAPAPTPPEPADEVPSPEAEAPRRRSPRLKPKPEE